MKQLTIALLLALGVATNGHAQETESAHTGYDQAAEQVQQQLREAVEELDALRSRIAEEKIPLSRRLNELENELSETRAEYQRTTRTLDSRSLASESEAKKCSTAWSRSPPRSARSPAASR